MKNVELVKKVQEEIVALFHGEANVLRTAGSPSSGATLALIARTIEKLDLSLIFEKVEKKNLCKGAEDEFEARATLASAPSEQDKADFPIQISRDEARLALFEASKNISIGNKTDDKLILDNLGKLGYCICSISIKGAQEKA